MNQNIRGKKLKNLMKIGKNLKIFLNQYWDKLNELFHKEIINYFNI